MHTWAPLPKTPSLPLSPWETPTHPSDSSDVPRPGSLPPTHDLHPLHVRPPSGLHPALASIFNSLQVGAQLSPGLRPQSRAESALSEDLLGEQVDVWVKRQVPVFQGKAHRFSWKRGLFISPREAHKLSVTLPSPLLPCRAQCPHSVHTNELPGCPGKSCSQTSSPHEFTAHGGAAEILKGRQTSACA